MKKSTKSKRIVAYLLVAVVVIQSATLVYLIIKTTSVSNDLAQVKGVVGMQGAEVDSQKLLQRPDIIAKEKLVAFPELGITLPYNDTTKTFQYMHDDENTRITSSLLTDHKVRQLSCSELVRINMKDGSPYSPWEEAAGSVLLSDGRTLSIIAGKAFKNNEASTEECASEVWLQITPSQVAEEFKKAKAL